MTTARCFGGVLDGTWKQTDGRELMAPVMKPIHFSPYVPDPSELSAFGVHRYTLQKFAVGGYRRSPTGAPLAVPIIFYALIGPGFTVAMVKAWLDGWLEEADRIETKGHWYYWERHHNKGGTMQDHGAAKARAEIANMEMRLENQASYIESIQKDKSRLRKQRDVAREDRQQVLEQRDHFQDRLYAVMDARDAAIRERDEAQAENDKIRRDRDNWRDIAQIRLDALLRG